MRRHDSACADKRVYDTRRRGEELTVLQLRSESGDGTTVDDEGDSVMTTVGSKTNEDRRKEGGWRRAG